MGPVGPQGPKGDQGIAGNPFPEAPNDGKLYGRGGTTVAWTAVLPLTGGTISGPVTVQRLNVSALPTSPTGLVHGDIWSNGGVLMVVP
jgi:hypothetical protein